MARTLTHPEQIEAMQREAAIEAYFAWHPHSDECRWCDNPIHSQREAGEAKGQPGFSTSHRANEAQLSMPPSRATSRIIHDHTYGPDCAEIDDELRSTWATTRTPRLSYATIGSEQRQAVLNTLLHLSHHLATPAGALHPHSRHGIGGPLCGLNSSDPFPVVLPAYSRLLDYATGVQR